MKISGGLGDVCSGRDQAFCRCQQVQCCSEKLLLVLLTHLYSQLFVSQMWVQMHVSVTLGSCCFVFFLPQGLPLKGWPAGGTELTRHKKCPDSGGSRLLIKHQQNKPFSNEISGAVVSLVPTFSSCLLGFGIYPSRLSLGFT